jgi:hypothetical protein
MQQADILKNVDVCKKILTVIRSKIITRKREFFSTNLIQLGGPGYIVQADKTMINHKFKAHRECLRFHKLASVYYRRVLSHTRGYEH